MGIKISCTNEDNISVAFTSRFSPFLLQNCDGIYEASHNVSTEDNTNMDGATYLGTTIKMRNIVLTLADESNSYKKRDLLYQLFKPKSPGTFRYEDGDEIREIEYYPESVVFTKVGTAQVATVSLLCPDPYFYDLDDSVAMMAEFLPSFHFAHEFKASKEELGYRQKEKIMTIANYIGVGGTGMTIEISCTGAVTNPVITHIETDKSITIGTDSKPLSMEAGDKVAISTYDGNKHVYLTHDGTTTKINNYLSEDSVFLQLGHGENSIGYSAKEGVDNMIVRITYKLRYASA